MILVFDSGSTKTSVALVKDKTQPAVIVELSSGHNAISAPRGALGDMISQSDEIMSAADSVTHIYYYGAGCATAEACENVRKELAGLFSRSEIAVASDMLGAARAVCGNSPGIVGILGTGSNSCLYDGYGITANVPPLGYILGDEGSGAVIGKRFLGLLFKGQFPEKIRREFDSMYGLNVADVLTKVYREPKANAFLASFAPFVAKMCVHSEVNQFVTGEFIRYIRYNLKGYDGFGDIPVHFIGSIADNFREQLKCALESEGGMMGEIIRSPIGFMADFHRCSTVEGQWL